MPVHPVLPLEGGKELCFLDQFCLACFDAGGRHGLAQILRGGRRELRLIAGELQNRRIDLVDAAERLIESGAADFAGLGRRPELLNVVLKAGIAGLGGAGCDRQHNCASQELLIPSEHHAEN